MSVIAIIPAAGIGQRMGAEVPKQYLTLLGKSILEQSVLALLADTRVQQVFIAVQPDDPYFSAQTNLSNHPQVVRVPGGASRAQSVLHGLAAAQALHGPDTLALVHDAARPGLSKKLLTALLDQAQQVPERGVVAAVPAWDTLKQTNKHGQVQTLDRSLVWHAFTPQIFPLQALLDAMMKAERAGVNVTDEASAMEFMGVSPILLEAEQQLRKITCPDDLIMVEALLKAQPQPTENGVEHS
ncbi:2-C-methyl-D-erythritol 4-phosphate cytidylyltransferase [Aliidiomarina taiwanensis]|uniref:2-C-methyl-D-erythritol 4-phosphate cytidylyltransferase n=1 Tax=Aliidiomarina taiwanensis TaxID=946228 RepID=A0A432X9X7_9GAMM|nr:2-C-methyl-D-erythritol 4-phosphate cytidylyltransferase [Aliidiomarina taiwanensis]RUO44223.1 2-C-methyl-D-erythritol 4-phosphate cytidylyltransferase [Aliidiomarina taiwanensis]